MTVRMIELVDESGNKLFLNPHHIVAVRDFNDDGHFLDGTVLIELNRSEYEVVGTAQSVIDKIYDATKVMK